MLIDQIRQNVDHTHYFRTAYRFPETEKRQSRLAVQNSCSNPATVASLIDFSSDTSHILVGPVYSRQIPGNGRSVEDADTPQALQSDLFHLHLGDRVKILYVEDEEIYTKPMQRLTHLWVTSSW